VPVTAGLMLIMAAITAIYPTVADSAFLMFARSSRASAPSIPLRTVRLVNAPKIDKSDYNSR
jgi:hypothetical protein